MRWLLELVKPERKKEVQKSEELISNKGHQPSHYEPGWSSSDSTLMGNNQFRVQLFSEFIVGYMFKLENSERNGKEQKFDEFSHHSSSSDNQPLDSDYSCFSSNLTQHKPISNLKILSDCYLEKKAILNKRNKSKISFQPTNVLQKSPQASSQNTVLHKSLHTSKTDEIPQIKNIDSPRTSESHALAQRCELLYNNRIEDSFAKPTVNFSSSDSDSSSNSDSSSPIASTSSNIIQHKSINNFKAAGSNRNFRNYSSRNYNRRFHERRSYKKKSNRNLYHSQKPHRSDSDSDSSSDSSMPSQKYFEIIEFILSYNPSLPKFKTITIPNSFQDSDSHWNYFHHAFYIEMGAILDKALEEAFLSYNYRLNLKIKNNSAYISPSSSNEWKFVFETQINDIVVIIPDQNNFPKNFEELKINDIPWTLGLINSDKTNKINILLSQKRKDIFKYSQKYILAIIGNITSLKREFSVFEKFERFSMLEQILWPQSDESYSESYETSTIKQTLQNKQYNNSQIEAIENSINSEGKISLIQGPPGTGKTSTVVGILSGLYARDENIKVLVCAQSNAAVDEIAYTVLTKGIFDLNENKRNDINLLRIGEKRQKHEIGVEEEIKTAKDIEQSINKIKLECLVEEKLKSEGLCDPTSEIKKAIEKLEKLEERLKELQKRGEYNLMNDTENEIQVLSDQLERLKEEENKYFCKKNEYKVDFIKTADAIFCTLSGSASMAVVQNIDSVDYLIIDEACQSIELSTLIPFQYNPKSVVLIGDPKQLPATTFSEISKINKYDRSFFERIMECNIRPVLLCQQYRMIPEISDFTSKTFYQNQIQCPKSVVNRKIPIWVKPAGPWFFNLAISQEAQAEDSLSYYNEYEADFVFKLYSILRKKTYNTNAQIGIISPYKGQVKFIEDLLYQRFGHSWKKNCEVSSVDGFQGREVDLVILSTVRSETIGFLRDERRMNVAISRAKYGMYAIGNEGCLSANPKWRSLIEYCKGLNKYMSCENFEDVRYIFNK